MAVRALRGAAGRVAAAGTGPRRRWWFGGTVAGLAAVVALTAFSCGGGTAPVAAHPVIRADFLVSYSGAAGRLDDLDPSEVDEQLRDWTRTALAAHLGVDAAAYRDESFDTLPIRDAGFSDLADQQVGPGRSLVDGAGVLHLLVERGDPHENRTVGLMLDQYRTDHGSDPALVQIHHYTVHKDTDTVDVTTEQPAATADVRTAHGYVSVPVATAGDLTAFLAKTQSLAQLSVRDGTVWVDGWHWPDVPAVPVTAQDVTVLQQGYVDHVQTGDPAPGFSLDPLTLKTAADVRAAIPDLAPDLAQAALTDKWDGTGFKSADDLRHAIEGALYENDPQTISLLPQAGLPTDRTELWSLYQLLNKAPVVQQARYDGGLAGTDVGMTLFYTDYVTKNWVAGVGQGVPAKAVGGFVPDSSAVTPWSECRGADAPAEETGRLWFGRNDAAFNSAGDHIDLGSQATRLFARSDGQDGAEVEPSFSFGRGLRWWDQHQQEVADYEPQYQRLDQIMRWSGALEWLTHQGTTTLLPQAAATAAPEKFKDWYAKSADLRERSPIPWVAPPSATQEALVHKPSATYLDCGGSFIEGGVSLSDLYDRTGDTDYRPALPPDVDRAGLFDGASAFDDASGTGAITEVSIDDAGKISEKVARTLSTDGATTTVAVKASGRKVIPFGDLKVWRSSADDRSLAYSFTEGDHSLAETVEYQGRDLGTLTTADTAGIVTMTWRYGLVDRMRKMLESVQDKLPGSSSPPSASVGPLYEMTDASGKVLDRVGGPGDPWAGVSSSVPAEGDGLAFVIGGPDKDTGAAKFYASEFDAGPSPPPGPAGAYLSVQPAAVGADAVARFVPPPDRKDRTVTVRTLDGRTAHVTEDGQDALAPTHDPVLGIDGTVEGAALLRDFPAVKRLLEDAAQEQDGYLRALALGDDGVALVGTSPGAGGIGEAVVYLAPSGSDIAGRVLRALGPDLQGTVVMEVLKSHGGIPDEIAQIGFDTLRQIAKPQSLYLGTVLSTPGVDGIYFSDSLRTALHLGDGPIVPESLPAALKVSVVAFDVGDDQRHSQATQPDVQLHQNRKYYLVGTVGLAAAAAVGAAANCVDDGATLEPSPGGPSDSPTPASPSGPQNPAVPVTVPVVPAGTILLVSPAADDAPAAC